MTIEAVTPMLSGKGLSLRRGREWLFKGLDFAVHPGQTLWLRGANGSGKTSLLRVATGLTRPEEGVITCRHRPLPAAPGFAQELVYLGHTHALKDDLTATESLEFLADLHGRDGNAQHIAGALKRLGVHHRRQHTVRTLSQGQRKRVALARLALECRPGIWVLDEPFDALDAEGIDTVNALILENLGRGGCVVLTSHIALRLNERTVCELHLGQASTS